MGRQMIPDEDDSLFADEAPQLLQKLDQAGGVVTIGLGSSKQACRLSIPAKTQSGGYRPLAPMIAARPQDRRFPSRRPSGSDRRLLREAGFVWEEDPGALADSVFFISGHRTSFQY
jgi:hypothetical protein